jgi:O-antigen/teichoic acid export membrane protein
VIHGVAVRMSAWLIAGHAISLLFSLISLGVIARVYGAADFGSLSLSLAIVGLVSPLIQLGLNAVVTRDLVIGRQHQGEILGTVVALRVLAAASALLLFALAFFFLRPGEEYILFVIVLLLAEVLRAGVVFSFWFESVSKGSVIAFATIGVALIVALARVALAFWGVDFIWIISSYVLEAALLGGFFWAAYRRWGGGARLEFSGEVALGYLAKCFPLIVSGITVSVYKKIDQLMLMHYFDVVAVGVYGLAARLSEAWHFIPLMVATAIFPHMIRLRESGSAGYYRYIEQVMTLLACIGYAAALGISIFAVYFLVPLVGEEYRASVPIVLIHVWGGVFIAVRALASKWIIAEDMLRFSLVSQGMGAVINVILNVLLIPYWGGEGAAIATVISYLVAGYLIFYFSQRTKPIFNSMTSGIRLVRVPEMLKSLRREMS